MANKSHAKRQRKLCNQHISLSAIKQYLLYGTYASGCTPCDKRSLRKRSQSFKIVDKELYYIVNPKRVEGEQPDPNHKNDSKNYRKAVLTPKEQLSVASSVHVQGNHMGTERTLTALSAQYYWVGMAATVRRVIKHCVLCLASRPAQSSLTSEVADGGSQAWDPDSSFLLPKGPAVTEGTKDSETPSGDTEMLKVSVDILSEGDGQFVVKEELTEPEQVDPDLNFNPDSVVSAALFTSREDVHLASRFWQKVELQLFGPFTYGQHHLFVIAAVDSFSKWPEVQVVDSFNEKHVAHFCIKLIARFGAMEDLIILDNAVSSTQPLDIKMVSRNLSLCSVNISIEESDPHDENWTQLQDTVTHFVNTYTGDWRECLDICLLPLRNSVSRAAEFTPAFLIIGREPIIPTELFPSKQSQNIEVSVSQEQLHQSVDKVVSMYSKCFASKHKVKPAKPLVNHKKNNQSPVPEQDVNSTERKSRGVTQAQDSNEQDENKKSTRTEDKSAPITSVEKKSGSVLVNLDSSVHNKKGKVCDPSPKLENQEDNIALDIFGKPSLDTIYRVVHLYKSEGAYPANCPEVFKHDVQRVAERFTVIDGELRFMRKGSKTYSTTVVMTMKERLDMMKEVHVKDGAHIALAKALEILNEKNVYWKGMQADLKAYIKACPDCKYGGQKMRNKVPAKTHWVKASALDTEQEGDSDTDTRGGSLSHTDLWLYIKKSVTPDNLSRSELLSFRRKARNFKIEKGVLYYCPPYIKKGKPRRVLKTDKEKQEALQEAHTDSGGEHVDQKTMKESLRKSVFWFGMTADIDKCLAACHQCGQPKCQLSSQLDSVDDVDKQDRTLLEKIKLFEDHFAGKDINPKKELLNSLFPSEGEITAAMSSKDQVKDCNALAAPTCDTINKELPESTEELQQDDDVPQEDNSSVETSDRSTEVDELQKKETTADANSEVEKEGDNRLQIVLEPRRSCTFERRPKLPKLPKTRKRCEVCQLVILGENNFKAHMYTHTGEKPFECNHCHKWFTNVKGLRLHIRSHTGHRPFLCNICGRDFPRSASLRYHMTTHERVISEEPIKCDVCNRSFTSINRLIKHKRFKHPAEAPVYACQVCDKIYTAKRSLKRHMEAHQGIRKFQCQYCKRKFFRKEYLNYHLMSHSDLDPSVLDHLNPRLKKKRAMLNIKRKGSQSQGLFTLSFEDHTGSNLTQDHPASSAADQQTYGQLIEVPESWTQHLQQKGTIVYELGPDGTLVPTSGNQMGTHMIVMEAAAGNVAAALSDAVPASGNSHGMDVQHIFLQEDGAQQHVQHIQQIDQLHQQQFQPSDQIQQLHQQPELTAAADGQQVAGVEMALQAVQSQQDQQQQQQQQEDTAKEVKTSTDEMSSFQQHQQTQQVPGLLTAPSNVGEPRCIEITLPSGATHTVTFPAGVGAGGEVVGQQDAQTLYQVECASGETLSDADFNAIHMLAQASLEGNTHHLMQQ